VKSLPEFFDTFSEVGVVNVVPIPVCVYGELQGKKRSEKKR
jgi:hypothetical protein